jgi:cysteinyl-tRNA synthetase
VIFDAVKRYLTYLGYPVTWVVNITDVDDKLIVEAAKQGTTVKELAERVTADYVANLKRLNVTSIDHMPRATDHIRDIQEMIQGLIDKGYAYPAGGDVYFDITKDEDYGKLCNRDPEQLEAGARIEVSEKKRSPGDFALWKSAKPGEPAWDSPWGAGRPGWHIECSAMSRRLLGDTFDIHGGGLDLQFPHHENELAQSESYTGKPFARFWMHNGLMKIGNDKISKTKEEEQRKKAVLGVTEVLQKHHPQTLRFLLLSTHYRSPIEYGEDRLAEVAKALQGFYRFFERYERITGASFYKLEAPRSAADHPLRWVPSKGLEEDVFNLTGSFLECMDDDFNTGGATGILFELLSRLNRYAEDEKLEAPGASDAKKEHFRRAVLWLRELTQILGLFGEPVALSKAGDGELVGKLRQLASDLGAAPASDADLDGLMQQFIQMRAEARKAKNFALADQIRKRLGELNVTLEDRPGGKTDWRLGS